MRSVRLQDIATLLFVGSGLLLARGIGEPTLGRLARRWTTLDVTLRPQAAALRRRRIALLLDLDPASDEVRKILAAYLAQVRLAKLQVLSLRAGRFSPSLRVNDCHHIDEALAAGRGVILWIAPSMFGPLLGKMALHAAGYALHHLSRYSHGYSPTVWGAKLLNPVRQEVENRYLRERIAIGRGGSSRDALRRLSRRLAENQVVTITAGAGGKQTMAVPFLTRTIILATGAPSLAARTGAALLPVFVAREGAASYVAHIGGPLPDAGGGSERSRGSAAAGFAHFLEHHVQAAPDQLVWHTDIFRHLRREC